MIINITSRPCGSPEASRDPSPPRLARSERVCVRSGIKDLALRREAFDIELPDNGLHEDSLNCSSATCFTCESFCRTPGANHGFSGNTRNSRKF